MSANSAEVLIIGESGVGKQALIKRILSRSSLSSVQQKGKQLWYLDTKYYTAQVRVDQGLPTPDTYARAATCGGLVLVFAANQESSFLAVKEWAEQLPSDSADVRLCIANKVDRCLSPDCSPQEPRLQHSAWRQQAAQWCADSLFEYIEVSSTDEDLDQQLVWEEQRQGVSRVREALEANMWPGLEMKSKPVVQNSQHQLPRHDSGRVKQAGHLQQEQSSTDSESDAGDFDNFQSAEEVKLDQLERMFDELKSKSDTSCASAFANRSGLPLT